MRHFKCSIVLASFLCLIGTGLAQDASQQPAVTGSPAQTAPAPAPANQATMDQIVDKIIDRENQFLKSLANFSPLVETYIQTLEVDPDLGPVPKDDKYFLRKLDLTKGIAEKTLLGEPGFFSKIRKAFKQVYSVNFLSNGFAQMIVIDPEFFTKENYDFTYIRREFLGEVRTLVFDVTPKPKAVKDSFKGRMWVEDQGYNIVRFNGALGPSTITNMNFHFDSWREQMGPGLWLPAYVYSEETDMGYFLGRRKLRFKGQTRLWGYNVGRPNQQNEFTALTVEADEVQDHGDAAEGMSPLLAQRAWERQAEDNILARLEKSGVLAPEGEVDKVLQTVITNLEVTNNIVLEPPIRARVLLTSPLESFTLGRTIVLSRGLIDVLPDEASLAMILAHEVAHIVLDHELDTKYAFNDRMMFDDVQTFTTFSTIKRNDVEELAADKKAAELLASSPYADKLGNAGLFLRAVSHRAKQLPNLLSPHLGNRMVDGSAVVRMTELINSAPNLEMNNVQQIAALPLGGRVRVDPWNNTLALMKAKPVALQSAREKMPFEVTPVFIYLTRQSTRTAEKTQ
jgi:hypothetical protein